MMTPSIAYVRGVMTGLAIALGVVIAVVVYQDRRYITWLLGKRWVRFPPPNEPHWKRGVRMKEKPVAWVLRWVGVCEVVYAGSVVDLLWFGRWVRR